MRCLGVRPGQIFRNGGTDQEASAFLSPQPDVRGLSENFTSLLRQKSFLPATQHSPPGHSRVKKKKGES